MSGAGLIEMLAARLARRAPREAAPELRQVLQSRMLRPEDIGDATRRDLSTWGPRGVAGDEILDRPIQVTPTSVDDLLANNPQFLEDPERAAEFAARSTPLPPVMMRGGKLIDGRHRLEAARIRGNDTIDAVDLDQFERPSAPSLRSALSEVNAARTGPDAGTAPNGIAPASFDESTTWYRGGRPGSGRTFLTRDRAMAERFARDLHGTDEVAAGNVAGGRQMVVDWSGRPWDAGPSGWSTDHMAEVARREGYDSVLLQNVESVRGSPADELVLLNENQFRTAPDGGSAREGFDTGRVVYRGLGRQYDPANGGYYQSFTSSLDDAREYGSNVIAAHIRPGRNLAIDGGGNNFNSLSVHQLPADVRARLHPSVGGAATTDQIAHAAREAGYDSVTVRNVHDNRWGERPVSGASPRTIDFVFNTENISPLDNIPPQASEALGGNGATLANVRSRLSDADRALLAELEDFPDSTQPNAGSDRNALQRALRDRMNRE